MKFKTEKTYAGISSHPSHNFIKNVFGINRAGEKINVKDALLKTNDNHKEIQDLLFYNKGNDEFFSYEQIFNIIKDCYIFSNKYIDFLTYSENIILRKKFLSRAGTILNKNILGNEVRKESYLIRMVLLGRSDKVSEDDWNTISSIINVSCASMDGFKEIPKGNKKRKYSCEINVSEAAIKASDFIYEVFSRNDIVYIDDTKIISKIILSIF